MTDEMKIIQHYGMKNQIKKFNEEAFELCEALIIYLSGAGYKEDVALDKIEEEIADVQVLLEQFKQYLNLNRKAIKKIYQYKIQRQLQRIEQSVVNNIKEVEKT